MAKNWPVIISGLNDLLSKVGPMWPESTKLSGFATDGPYSCANCEYLVNGNRCKQEVVKADPEVPRDSSGLAIISDAAHTCCEFVEPVKQDKEEQGPKLVAIFMRHGQTEANKEKRFRGALEIPLDSTGRQQALDARRFLAGFLGGKELGPAYTSSKDRTIETGRLTLGPGKTQVIKDFDALNVGKFSGEKKSPENMKEILHYQSNPDQKIPGGERINDFRKRVDPNIMRVIEEGDKAGKPTLSFVHSSIIHEISHLFHGDHNAIKVIPGGIVGVYKRPSGSYFVQALLNPSKGPQDQLMS